MRWRARGGTGADGRAGRRIAVVLTALTISGLVGCDSPTEPPEWSYIQALVEEVEPNRLFVRMGESDPCGIWFATDAGTVYAERVDGDWREMDRAELAVGSLVRVWIAEGDGIRESCPGQGDAIWIGVLQGER